MRNRDTANFKISCVIGVLTIVVIMVTTVNIIDKVVGVAGVIIATGILSSTMNLIKYRNK